MLKRPVQAALALLLSGASDVAMAKGTQWRISESSGPVSVFRNGLQTVVTRGAQIRAGDTIATGKSGRAVVTRDQQFVILAPESRIRLPDDPEPDGFTRIVEEFGSVIFRVRKRATQHFRVETPYLAAVVKGTTFNVRVDTDGARVQVVEGAVEVSTLDGQKSDLAEAGGTIGVRADAPGELSDNLPETVSPVVATRIVPAV
jgi:hypothetical protein